LTTVALRRARPDDLPTLLRWDEAPHVIAASGTDGGFDWATEVPREIDWREILIGTVDGRPVGVLVVIDAAREETHYWGDCGPGLRAIDIWLGEADDLGRGHGTAMMRAALDRCFADPSVEAVLVDPLADNERAHRFYRRCGFRPVGRRTFGDDDCLVHRIDRPSWADRPPSPRW